LKCQTNKEIEHYILPKTCIGGIFFLEENRRKAGSHRSTSFRHDDDEPILLPTFLKKKQQQTKIEHYRPKSKKNKLKLSLNYSIKTNTNIQFLGLISTIFFWEMCGDGIRARILESDRKIYTPRFLDCY